MPIISVIIPVYNKEATIKRVINSVLNQSFTDFELIIINDGSIDNSEENILKYQEKDSRIIYLKQENKGVAFARNVGIEYAKSKYISFLDADDEIDNLFLQKMLDTILDANVCYCGHYDVLGGKSKKSKFSFVEGDVLEDYLFNRCTPNTNSWLIKKEYIDQFKIRFSIDIDWGEDMEFFSKILLYDINVKCVKQFLTYYHKGQPNSLSTNNLSKIDKDVFWLERLIEYIEKYELDFRRKTKIVSAILSYRLPASIIYRIYSNKNNCDKQILKCKMRESKEYLKKIEISNGLRSIKLYYIYFKLKFALRN
jgi:glycosyltransferase involved in cell wall biosynthesis